MTPPRGPKKAFKTPPRDPGRSPRHIPDGGGLGAVPQAPGRDTLPDSPAHFRHQKSGPLLGLPGFPPSGSKQLWRTQRNDQNAQQGRPRRKFAFKTAQEAPRTLREGSKIFPQRAPGRQNWSLSFGKRICLACPLSGYYRRSSGPRGPPKAPQCGPRAPP